MMKDPLHIFQVSRYISYVCVEVTRLRPSNSIIVGLRTTELQLQSFVLCPGDTRDQGTQTRMSNTFRVRCRQIRQYLGDAY